MSEEDIYVCLSCDVEGSPVEWAEELSGLMKIVNRYKAKITLFVSPEWRTDSFLEHKISNILHSIENKGHEIGLHIHWGSSRVLIELEEDSRMGVRLCRSYRSSLRNFTRTEIAEELEKYLKIMSELDLFPVSFRGGGLCQTTECLRILNEHGFEVDSSVAPGLNEKGGWHQDHGDVPYDRGYYYPSKASYALPASDVNEKIGIVEVPVSRMEISDGSWSSILEPATRDWKRIYNWVVSRQKIVPRVITPICHSWMMRSTRPSWIVRSLGFLHRNMHTLSVLGEMLRYLKNEERVVFTTMKEFKETLGNL